jgi:hypothetical protein
LQPVSVIAVHVVSIGWSLRKALHAVGEGFRIGGPHVAPVDTRTCTSRRAHRERAKAPHQAAGRGAAAIGGGFPFPVDGELAFLRPWATGSRRRP